MRLTLRATQQLLVRAEAVHVAAVSQAASRYNHAQTWWSRDAADTERCTAASRQGPAIKPSCGETREPPHLSPRCDLKPDLLPLAVQSPVGPHAQLLLPHCVVAQPCQHQVEGKLAHAGG